MKITRDVITDLLPAYQSGEASPDTQRLVEAYFEQDPEFARLVRAGQESLPGTYRPNLPKETEMITLDNTRKLLWQRSVYLGAGIFFTCFAFAFHFDRLGIHWIWAGTPVTAAAFLAVGLFFWALFARATRSLKGSDL